MNASLEGKTVVLPQDGGRFKIATIRNVEDIAMVDSKEEADKLVKLLNAATLALTGAAINNIKTNAPAPRKPVAKTGGPKKVGAKARKVSATPARRRARKTAATRAGKGRASGTVGKETVDVGRLAEIVDKATS